eukprot:533938-Prymnesium_polylepis.1
MCIRDRAFLDAVFPSRITFHRGASQRMVLEYARRVQRGEAAPCDLWYIDANHDVPWVWQDFRVVLAAAAFDGYVMADDYSLRYPGVRQAWRAYTERQMISPVDTFMYVDPDPRIGPKGWAIGRWNATALKVINHQVPSNCSSRELWCEFPSDGSASPLPPMNTV